MMLQRIERIELHDEIRGELSVWERRSENGRISVIHSLGEHRSKIEYKLIETRGLNFMFPRQNGHLYEFGLPFLVKREVENTTSHLEWIKSNICRNFLECVPILKKDFKLSWLDFIPIAEKCDDALKDVILEIYGHLRKSDCILSDSGRWVSPDKCIHLPRELLSEGNISQLLNGELVHNECKLSKNVAKSLHIAGLDRNTLQKILQNEEWVEDQSDEWFASLYRILGRDENKSLISECRDLPIIRLNSGKTVKADENVCFHGGLIQDYLAFIDYVPRRFEEDLLVSCTLLTLGVLNFSPDHILRTKLIPAYQSQQSIGQDDHIEHAMFLSDYFVCFSDESRELVRLTFPLLSDRGRLQPADHLYISRTYTEFGPYLNDFLETDFISHLYLEQSMNLSTSIPKEIQVRRWRDLFLYLNALVSPLPVRFEESLTSLQSKSRKYGHYGAKVSDFKPSLDIQRMCTQSIYDAITYIDSHWDLYSAAMERRIVTGDFRLKNLGILTLIENSEFLVFLREQIISSSSGKVRIVGTLYGPNSKVYGSIYPFYLGEIKHAEFRRYLGIFDDFSPLLIIDSLKRLKYDSHLNNEDKTVRFLSIIEIISKMSLDYDEEYIEEVIDPQTKQLLCELPKKSRKSLKDLFCDQSLIFLHEEWYTAREIYWAHDPILFMEFDVPSVDSFPEFKIFRRLFKSLGVGDQRPLTDVFRDLSSFRLSDTNQTAIFSIYAKIADWIERNHNMSWIQKSFSSDPFLLTSKGFMIAGSSKIYLNDDNDISDKFKEVLILFEPPRDQFSRLMPLMDCLSIQPLSIATKITVNNQLVVRDKIGEEHYKIILRCVETYLYYHQFTQLEKLKDRKFTTRKFELKTLKEKINATYELGKYKFHSECGVKYDRVTNSLYLSETHNGNKEVTDEIARIFGSYMNREFKLFLFGLISCDDAEEFMEVYGLPFPSKDMVEESPKEKHRGTASPVELRKMQDYLKVQMLNVVDQMVESTLEEPIEVVTGPPKKTLFRELESFGDNIEFDHYMPRNTLYYEKESRILGLEPFPYKPEQLDQNILKIFCRLESKRLAHWNDGIEDPLLIVDLTTKDKVKFALQTNPMFVEIYHDMGLQGYDFDDFCFSMLCIHPQTRYIDRLIMMKTCHSRGNRFIEISDDDWEASGIFRDFVYLYFVENLEGTPSCSLLKDIQTLQHDDGDFGIVLDLSSSKHIEKASLKAQSPPESPIKPNGKLKPLHLPTVRK